MISWQGPAEYDQLTGPSWIWSVDRAQLNKISGQGPAEYDQWTGPSWIWSVDRAQLNMINWFWPVEYDQLAAISQCLVKYRPLLLGVHLLLAAQLWTVPELLRQTVLTKTKSTQSGDVYSLGLLLYSIAGRTNPYQGDVDEIPLTQQGDNFLLFF